VSYALRNQGTYLCGANMQPPSNKPDFSCKLGVSLETNNHTPGWLVVAALFLLLVSLLSIGCLIEKCIP
jgi:hypothetical protein